MTVKVSKPAINVREELADLRKPSGVAGEAMLRAETPQEQRSLIGLGQRNMIINGDFQVWQRGTSGTSGFVADRWKGLNCSSQSKQYDADVGNYIQFTATNAAVMYYGIELPETGKVTPFEVGETYTVSLKVKSDALMHKPNVSFRDGIGGGTNTVFTSVEIKPHMATGEWEDVVYQFTVTSAPHSTAILFELTLVSFEYANTPINIAQVQIVKGKVATPFDHPRSYGEELALCQRYFERKHYEYGALLNTTNWTYTDAYGGFEYTTKRATPAATVSSISDFNHYGGGTGRAVTGLVVQSEGVQVGTIRVITGGTLTLYQSSWIEAKSGGGYFDIDAEL